MARKSRFAYVYDRLAMFGMTVVFIVGDLDECAKFLDSAPALRRFLARDAMKTPPGTALRKAAGEASMYPCDFSALTVQVDNVILIYAPEPLCLMTLVHETSHAANRVMDTIGSQCDELRAYLCGWLFDGLAADDRLVKRPQWAKAASDPAATKRKERRHG